MKTSVRITAILALLLSYQMVIKKSAAQGVDESTANCAARIGATCDYTLETGIATAKCCTAVNDAANNNTDCFCLAYYQAIAQYPDSTTTQFNDFLFTCNIPATVYSVCAESHIPTPTAPPPTTSGNKGMIIGITVAGIVLVIAIIVGVTCFCCRRKSTLHVENYTHPAPIVAKYTENGTVAHGSLHGATTGIHKDGLATPDSLQYRFADLQVATNNFSKENKIGRGGFGIVYEGLLPNGQQIAVKRLTNRSSRGEKEFETEIVHLSKLQHKNLVRLLGFCLAGDEALLVYEFVPNKSLDNFLFDSNKRSVLNWSRRFGIIKGIARGMMYLHEDAPAQIMHRDLKAANVLLDSEMCPKIADFGLARICDIGLTHINPTQVVGTQGYMAPEYMFHGQFSVKSDVYSLGVLILEIVSGRRAGIGGSSFNQPGGEGLLSFAWSCWEDEAPLEVMDPILRGSFSRDEVKKCVQLGLLCVQEDTKLRPTMSTVVHILNFTSGGGLSMPQQPAFIYSGSSYPTTTKSNTTSSVP